MMEREISMLKSNHFSWKPAVSHPVSLQSAQRCSHLDNKLPSRHSLFNFQIVVSVVDVGVCSLLQWIMQ
jgi:hypothetical protein